VIDTVVLSEEELRARLEAGARLSRDKKGFKLYYPKVRRWERVSVSLRDVAARLYAEQKQKCRKTMVHLGVLVPPELKKELEERARAQNINVSELVRRLLEQGLQGAPLTAPLRLPPGTVPHVQGASPPPGP